MAWTKLECEKCLKEKIPTVVKVVEFNDEAGGGVIYFSNKPRGECDGHCRPTRGEGAGE